MAITDANKELKKPARRKLIEAGTKLFRQEGYAATTVDQICEAAGAAKGTFFHHFKSKEMLGAACLVEWDMYGASIDKKACASDDKEPIVALVEFMDGIIDLFGESEVYQSCLAGTIIHEIAQTSPPLREGVQIFFKKAEARFQMVLDDACVGQDRQLDTPSLAALWLATMQGSFTLCKASGDREIVRKNLSHLKQYILQCLGQTQEPTEPAGNNVTQGRNV